MVRGAVVNFTYLAHLSRAGSRVDRSRLPARMVFVPMGRLCTAPAAGEREGNGTWWCPSPESSACRTRWN